MKRCIERSATALALGLAFLLFANAPPAGAVPAGTAFSYQGHLRQFGSFVHGNADLRFTLYDASGGGAQVGAVNSLAAVGVNRGVFSVELDFGTGAFDGDERWLEIEVRQPAGSGAYTLLTPRVELLAVPYAQVSLEGSVALTTHAADAGAHHAKTTDASELTTGSLGDARLSGNVSLLGADIAEGELDFDPATQGELDVHLIDVAAHHAKTVNAGDLSAGTLPDARLSVNVSQLGPNIAEGELAFDPATQPELNSHSSGIGSHHTRYTNGEATAAVAAADSYVFNTGDTVTGTLAVNDSENAVVVNGGSAASATTSYGFTGYAHGIGTKHAAWLNAGSSSHAGVSYGVRSQAFSSNSDQFGGWFLAGSNGAGGAAYGVDVQSFGTGTKYGGRFRSGDSATGGTSYGISSQASGNSTKYGGYFTAGSGGSAGNTWGVYSNAQSTDSKVAGYFTAGDASVSGGATGLQVYAYSSDSIMRGGLFQAGTGTTTSSAYGIDATANGDGNKWGGKFQSGTNADPGFSYGIEAKALGTSTKYGAFLRAGEFSSPTSGASYGVRTDADGTGTTYGGYFTSGADTIAGAAYGVSAFADSSTGARYGAYFNASGAGIGTAYGVYAVGDTYDFYAAGGGVDYGTSSSARWKENVEPIGEPLEKVGRLRGVTFDWDAEHGGRPGVGMIAEEVGAVLPEIVVYEDNGIDAVGMDYSKLTPLLVEAVKALSEENAALRQQLAELGERVDRIAGSGI